MPAAGLWEARLWVFTSPGYDWRGVRGFLKYGPKVGPLLHKSEKVWKTKKDLS